MRSSACSAARSRLVASGAPALSLIRRLSCRSCRRSRLCGRIRGYFQVAAHRQGVRGRPRGDRDKRLRETADIFGTARLCS